MIPLTARSAYSLMWGVPDVGALCRHARRLGYERLALTDTDNLYGLWPFLAACEREGVRPMIGAEITDRNTSRRAVCLVKNVDGYRNLCRLLTRRHTAGAFDLKTDFMNMAEGLVALASNAELLTAWREAGADVVAAMPRRPVHAGHSLRKTAARLNIPLVATPGSFFLDPDDRAVHRVLRAIDRKTTVSRLKPGDTAPDDAFLASPEEYAQRFAVCPEAIRNTVEVAERIVFSRPKFGLVMPPYVTSTVYNVADHPYPDPPPSRGREESVLLRRAAYQGAHRRYGELSEPVVDRLEHELKIITEMNFAGYFLVVADIVAQSPRTCGRGSGAASLVAFCLGITHVCPIRHNLYFERFLNPGRTDPPDIDVDFAWDERDHVIGSVLAKYKGHAAMVASHVCFQPRMAVRETAKVFGLPDGEIGRTTKRLPWFRPWESSEESLAESSDRSLLERMAALPQMRGVEFPEPWPDILALARRIIGLPRCLSVHPGGVVITPEPIDTHAPVEIAPKGVPVIQWDKDAVEDAGLVKIDLLGNRSLGVIRDAMANARENGLELDEHRWAPEDDPRAQETIRRGNTMGCFYIESPAMRLLQQKTGVGDFDHLVIHSSIIRPAANDVIQEYLHRLHGGPWTPIHPLLEDVLSETFGLMVYQEDVSRVAVRIAGFSHAEADGLRKVMARKDREHRLRDYLDRFRDGARANGVRDEQIREIWRMIMSFNGYSFCKPHSASYARISFQAAWLKTHYPAEFMAAVISNQGGFYSTFAYVSEARRMGITLLPPDVTISRISWTGQGARLRVGLLSIQGVSAETRRRIVSERERAPFSDLTDFFDRVRPDEDEVRALIHGGALDRFHPRANRAVLFWLFSAWRRTCDRDKPVLSLFGDDAPLPAPELPEEDVRERLRREFKVLGFLCDRHPITLFDRAVRESKAVRAMDLQSHTGRRVRFAGWLITGKTVLTAQDDPMKFVTFEDDTGIVEAVLFPAAYNRFCHLLEYGRPYLLSGRVEMNWGAVTLSVESIRLI